MANNYQSNNLGFGGAGGVINSGATSAIPPSGSDDANMLNQQLKFAALCSSYIQNSGRVNTQGKDITREVQKYLASIVAATPLSFAQAQVYYPNVSSKYWTGSLIDYMAAYTAIQAVTY